MIATRTRTCTQSIVSCAIPYNSLLSYRMRPNVTGSLSSDHLPLPPCPTNYSSFPTIIMLPTASATALLTFHLSPDNDNFNAYVAESRKSRPGYRGQSDAEIDPAKMQSVVVRGFDPDAVAPIKAANDGKDPVLEATYGLAAVGFHMELRKASADEGANAWDEDRLAYWDGPNWKLDKLEWVGGNLRMVCGVSLKGDKLAKEEVVEGG
ncbi:hypothetical protein GSI_07972 [Ganoderma sinense ZZ0214-1]|uniref:Uncharacterized protein n=1 Tax=Ganoderma sinense ZZ0214-1 TaxID=1077348 RepID=A0A2G8S7R0_9APHY|nr:hypothetical protein GSI_07972 [Ganoderma sinense ZZ0214-1]